MKNIILLIVLSATINCISCKGGGGGDAPPKHEQYIDLANLFDIYYKDIDKVKASINATYVTERDSVFQYDMYETRTGRVLVFTKDTPAGAFYINCLFHNNLLLDVKVKSRLFDSPIDLLPHYMAVSDGLYELTKSKQFPYGANYIGHLIDQYGTSYADRAKFLTSATDFVKENSHKSRYDFKISEWWDSKEEPDQSVGDQFFPIEMKMHAKLYMNCSDSSGSHLWLKIYSLYGLSWQPPFDLE